MSDKQKFTRGPYMIMKMVTHTEDWTGSSFIIRAKDAPGGLAAVIGGLGLEEEEANAQLLAASWEMRAALEATRMLNLHLNKEGTIGHTVYQQVEAALRHARGEK